MIDQDPLAEEEIEELDQFLLNARGIEESMDVSTLDGFLTAIANRVPAFDQRRSFERVIRLSTAISAAPAAAAISMALTGSSLM